RDLKPSATACLIEMEAYRLRHRAPRASVPLILTRGAGVGAGMRSRQAHVPSNSPLPSAFFHWDAWRSKTRAPLGNGADGLWLSARIVPWAAPACKGRHRQRSANSPRVGFREGLRQPEPRNNSIGARPSLIVPGEPALAGPSHEQPVELFL